MGLHLTEVRNTELLVTQEWQQQTVSICPIWVDETKWADTASRVGIFGESHGYYWQCIERRSGLKEVLLV